MKSSLSLFISSTVILISVDCDSSPVFRDVFMACSLSLTGVSVCLALQLWLTSACCRVVVIQLWFSSSTFSITHKQLLPWTLIQTTKTPHTAPRYPCLIINRTNPLMGTMWVKWVKCTHSSLVSWFGSIWSDNELKLHRVIRRHRKHLVSVLKAQWLSFLQSWLGRFWLQLDSPTELAQTPRNTLALLFIYEAYFHHGIKHLKKRLFISQFGQTF